LAGEFTGWPEEAYDVLLRLEGDPPSAERERLRADRLRLVHEPMDALCADLADSYHGSGHVWGLHKNSWLWQHQRAHFTVARQVHVCVQFDLDGLLVEAGWMRAEPGSLERYRASVAAEPTGTQLASHVAALMDAGYELDGNAMKRPPRGIPGDHPRADLLRLRGFLLRSRLGCEAWLHKPEAVDHVRAAFTELRPLTSWLAEHVAGDRR
jgi:uncharacterized protein DUF2461